MFGLNPAQTEGQVRTFIAFFGGVAAALGWTWWDTVSSAFVNTISPVLAAIGPIMGLAAAIWSAFNKKEAGIMAMATSLVDDKSKPLVQRILLAPTAAGEALERATSDLPQVSTAPLIPTGPAGMGSMRR